jgi:hypothetical protein
MTNRVAEAVERGDLDALVRLVDGLASAREWDRIVELRDRCRHALERGLQLWPAAEYAEYRLALEAPPAFAGPVVTETAGRFALGPLWEVAASTHDWAALAPHLPGGPARALVAHERVLRGEDLNADGTIDPGVLETPLGLEPWEPSYPVATYRASKAEFPTPDPVTLRPWQLPAAGAVVRDREGVEALLALALPWAEQSNGTAAAIAVEGDAAAAVAALDLGPASSAAIAGREAIAWMAWTGASGGAYGRRRGGPLGRFAAWWALVTLAGLEWPAESAELAAACRRLQWHRWEPAGSTHGWSASLAVTDPERGLSWALYAVDDAREAKKLTADS